MKIIKFINYVIIGFLTYFLIILLFYSSNSLSNLLENIIGYRNYQILFHIHRFFFVLFSFPFFFLLKIITYSILSYLDKEKEKDFNGLIFRNLLFIFLYVLLLLFLFFWSLAHSDLKF